MEENFGMVSVVMPSYNSSAFIGESIEAIIGQTYTNWEMLITDDCSTDNTCEIIQEYISRDGRIRLFRLESNQGAGVARNRSISEAKGRYIAFCDSDDVWKPEKLAVQLRYMAEHRVEVCYASYLTCDECGSITGRVVAPARTTFRKVKQDDPIGFLTLIYDTQRLGKVYMPLLRKRQDWGLVILLMERCHEAFGIKDTLAVYRIRRGSISRNKFALVTYNLAVYKEVLHYGTLKAWAMFLLVFLPHYFFKKLSQKLVYMNTST